MLGVFELLILLAVAGIGLTGLVILFFVIMFASRTRNRDQLDSK